MRGVDVDIKKEMHTPQTKPYDDSIWENWLIYDSMPYRQDPELFVERAIRLVSGNIVKSCRIQMVEPYEIKHE